MISVPAERSPAATAIGKPKERRTLADRLEEAPGLYLILFTVIYAATEFCSNLRRPFWFDELISYYLADLPSIGQIWPLIARGIELNPPLPFWITWVIHHTIGQGEVATRLPALAGFWLMCVCLHYFVRRRSDALHGFWAMLLPLFTYTAAEATWARGYGLMLGSSAAALLCWQLAADGIRRSLALVGLAVSVATAVSCHYYALYVAGALALGEFVRTLDRKRIDYRIWLALLTGVSPLAAYLSLMRTLPGAAHAFWIAPMVRNLYESYADLAGPMIALLLGFAAATRSAGRCDETPRWNPPTLERHEVTVCLALVAMPLAVYAGSNVTPLAFYSRYVQPAVIGFSIIVAMFVYRIGGGSRHFRNLTASLVIGICFVPWMLLQIIKPLALAPPGAPIQGWIEVPQDSNLKLVIDNENDYLILFHYAPANIREHIVFLSDRRAAVEYLGSDTGLRSLELLQTFHNVNLVDYHKFISEHREFLLERSRAGSSITQKLLTDGATMQLIRLHKGLGVFVDDRLLFRVTMPPKA